jgi:hypothetical protein
MIPVKVGNSFNTRFSKLFFVEIEGEVLHITKTMKHPSGSTTHALMNHLPEHTIVILEFHTLWTVAG